MSVTTSFSRYAALLSLGSDLEDDLGFGEAIEAAGERVGWASLDSNSWRSDRGLSFTLRWQLDIVLPLF